MTAGPAATNGDHKARLALFHRDLTRFTGGHLKMWHHFTHVRAMPGWDAVARFTARSVWGEANPWSAATARVVADDVEVVADAWFLAGLDWEWATPPPAMPVVNVIQHVRHADPDDPRHRFLDRPAIRVCVSPEVEAAILTTGKVRGPTVVIPNALDVRGFDAGTVATRSRPDVVIGAAKDPEIGRQVARQLRKRGRRIVLLDAPTARSDFLALLAAARVAVLVPNPTEGWYLPALEAMALGSVVVTCDAIGNRSFCRDDTCLLSPRDATALADRAEAALALDGPRREALLHRARAEAGRHDLAAERAAVGRLLDDLDRLWREAQAGSSSATALGS